jgi:ABC-type branched-subunit amino acid transport system permease subunit
MKHRDRTRQVLAISFLALLISGPFLPQWALFLATLSMAKGLVVLGLLLLMRAGLVSFGQGLYYCLGAYAVGTLGQFLRISDALLMLLFAIVASCAVAAVLGLLLAAYRSIFFAMLSLAFSMVLYGLLVKSSALGSTDGFNIAVRRIAGLSLDEHGRYLFFALSLILALSASLGVHGFLRSNVGRLAAAVRDNELRVEYLGASVRAVVYFNILIAAALAGLGGGLTALVVGHIDPDMAYWTTSGEFVFIAILSGTGSVLAPFLGSLAFEVLRSFAYQYSPNTWQMVVGFAMLFVIALLPSGLWSIFALRRRAG